MWCKNVGPLPTGANAKEKKKREEKKTGVFSQTQIFLGGKLGRRANIDLARVRRWWEE